MPTHRRHPENQQDSIRFSGLVKELGSSLKSKFSNKEIEEILMPLNNLVSDSEFWNHTLDGLAVLFSPDYFEIYRLPNSFAEIAISADSFHVKPLLKFMQTTDRYNVLSLSLNSVKLYEGSRHDLYEIDLDDDIVQSVEQLTDGGATKLAARSLHLEV